MEHNKRTRSENFFGWVKNLFWLFLFISVAPSLLSGLRTTLEELIFPKVHVGCLTINGSINDASFYIKKIDEFSKASDIKALLLKINSPGGYSGSCNVIFNELLRFKKNKPIVAVIENAGASGAYYIAATANTIIAAPLSVVGSIGVFMELPNVKELLSSWKVDYRYVQSGEYKTAGSAVKELSAKELTYLQALTDAQYQQFVSDIAQCRNLDLKNEKVWANGRVFSGHQAHELKLIDKLGSLSDGVDELKRLLKTDEELRFVHAKKVKGLMRFLSEDDDFGHDSMSLSDSVASFVSSVYQKCTFQQQACVQSRL